MDDSMDASAFEVDASSDFEPEPKLIVSKAYAIRNFRNANHPYRRPRLLQRHARSRR